MRLVGTLEIHIPGNFIEREPTLFEKLRRGLGGTLDLSTNKVRVELEATAMVDQVRRAVGRLGVSNALSLVIDDTVIFEDSAGKHDDLPDLVIALSEHASVFGRGFKELRFAAEHEEGNLHLVIETRALTEHDATQPAAVVSVGGRLTALEPQPGESPETYRARVEPFTKDTVVFETARLQFQAFIGRLENALRAAMPQARIEEKRAEARLVKPTSRVPAERPVTDPTHPGYDPFLRYYPMSPMGLMLDAMIISSFMHAMHPSPNIFVTNPQGTPLGTAQQVAAEPERLESGDQGASSNQDHSDDQSAEPSADDDGGGDMGDDGGGYSDGGDFGGGDF
jgi:hypothetical protein